MARIPVQINTIKVIRNPDNINNYSEIIYRKIEEQDVPNVADRHLEWNGLILEEMTQEEKNATDQSILIKTKTEKIAQFSEDSLNELQETCPDYKQRNAAFGYIASDGEWVGVYDREKTESIRQSILLQKTVFAAREAEVEGYSLDYSQTYEELDVETNEIIVKNKDFDYIINEIKSLKWKQE